jgi:hypothetical protein
MVSVWPPNSAETLVMLLILFSCQAASGSSVRVPM